MIPLAALAAIICVGIGVDFSGQTMAEQDLRDIAAHCAREGAARAAVGADATQTGIDTAEACLAGLGLEGIVTATDTSLSVALAGTYRTKLLSVISVNSLPVRGTASVSLLSGR